LGGDAALLLLDLSDPDALRFLRFAASSSGAVGHAPHVLALLPGMAAARSVRGSLGLGSEKALQAGNTMRSDTTSKNDSNQVVTIASTIQVKRSIKVK